MERRNLIVVDERSQGAILESLRQRLKQKGIELHYKEINPAIYLERLSGEEFFFNEKKFISDLRNISFINYLDIFATDYNLIAEYLKGIDIIRMFKKVKPFFSKKVVIYSAKIEDVITDILDSKKGFEHQKDSLKILTNTDIEYLKSDGELKNSLGKLIEHIPNHTLDNLLADTFMALGDEKCSCILPSFQTFNLSDIGELLTLRSDESYKLKKEIVDFISAIIIKMEEYE